MKQYLDLLEEVRYSGTRQRNRTGIDTLRIEGAHLKFDMMDGFPAITTKQLAFKSVVGELLGFLRSYDNAAKFRELGCKIWDQNANENLEWLRNPARKGVDDLGRIYGVQWRRWIGVMGDEIDQIANAVHKIMYDPQDRRIIVTAWEPSDLTNMALPPCHVMHQYICDPERKELHLCMYQRSCDMFLGIPFNIASYALLLNIMSLATGYTPRHLNMFLADVHIYKNHFEAVHQQLSRRPYELPRLKIHSPKGKQDKSIKVLEGSGMPYIEALEPWHFELEGYIHWPSIKAPMAV